MTTATYTPAIEEAFPRNDTQRTLAAQGYRGFYVEASGKTSKRIDGARIRIVRYLLTVMPDGYVKCPCVASQHGKPCRHKQDLEAHLASESRQDAYYAQCEEDAAVLCSDDRCDGQPADILVHGIALCAEHACEFLPKQRELVAALEMSKPATRAEAFRQPAQATFACTRSARRDHLSSSLDRRDTAMPAFASEPERAFSMFKS